MTHAHALQEHYSSHADAFTMGFSITNGRMAATESQVKGLLVYNSIDAMYI